MAAAKKNQYAKGKGAIQTGLRQPKESYVVSFSARFDANDDTGHNLKSIVKQHYKSDKAFLIDSVTVLTGEFV